MSTEYDARQLSDIRERQMIANAVKRGFTAEELEELETRALAMGNRKKNRPVSKAVYVAKPV